ncbi:MAG: sigma-70 family RNA polymerase sigma factor [Bacteroidota bacterium]
MDKNFGLSSDDFETLIDDLKKNETDFFKNVFLKHFQDCVSLVQRKYNASFDDAYDAVMDTLIKFRSLLVDGKLKYGNLRYLFNTMASQIYLKNTNKFKSQEFQETDLYELDFEDNTVDEDDLTLFNAAWVELGADCQELLKLYYYGNMKLIEISDYLEKSPEATRKQKERCIKSMRKILKTKKEKI